MKRIFTPPQPHDHLSEPPEGGGGLRLISGELQLPSGMLVLQNGIGAGSPVGDPISIDLSFLENPVILPEQYMKIKSVTSFGATGEELSDDTDALLAAWEWAAETGNKLWHPPGTYNIETTLPMTKGFCPIAPLWGGTGSGASFAPLGAQLVWQGPNTGSDFMVDIKAATPDTYVQGFGWENLILNGNNLAFGGLKVSGGRHFRAGAIAALACRGVHVQMDDVNGDVLTGQGTIEEIRFNARANAACLNARGLVLRGTDTTQPAGLTQLKIGTISGQVQYADAVQIGDMDSWTIGHFQCGTNEGYYGLRLRGPGSDGNNRAARKGAIGWFSGKGKAEPGAFVFIDHINGENSGIERDPGAVVITSAGIMDKDKGAVYRDQVFVTSENIDLSINDGAAFEGAVERGTTGAQAARILAFPPDETSTWQWTFVIPDRWRRGRFRGFRLVAMSDDGSGPAVFRMGVSARPEASGFGAAPAYAPAVTLNLAEGFSKHEVIFASPLDNLIAPSNELWQANTFQVRLSRLGLDAADTLAAHALVLAFRPIWQEAGPGGDYSFNSGGTIVRV